MGASTGTEEGALEGVAIAEELAPQPGEVVVDKYGYGAFYNTVLSDALLARGCDRWS